MMYLERQRISRETHTERLVGSFAWQVTLAAFCKEKNKAFPL